MAKLEGGKLIRPEDFAKDDRRVAEKLGFILNPHLEQVINAFQKRITITENLDMEFKLIDIEVDANGFPVGNSAVNTTIGGVSGMLVMNTQLVNSLSSINISSISAASPSVITTAEAHGFGNGQLINIGNTDSTPSVDGNYKITVLSDTEFSIPVTVSGAGSTGNVIATSYLAGFPMFAFSQDENTIRIQHISGLNPNIKYRLNVLIIGS